MDERILMGQVLDFAIGEEEAAAEFYSRLAAQASVPGIRKLLESFSSEEKRHKAKLETIKLTGIIEPIALQEPVNLKISDYLAGGEPLPDLDYRSALMLAITKEKFAFKLYEDLAETAPNETLKKTFQILVQEEVGHRQRFEAEYNSLPLI